MEEIWRQIEFGKGNYYVSNLGRIKSIVRGKEHILVQTKNRNGYLYAMLSNGYHHKNVLVHKMVAIYFLPNELNMPMVNHKDENKLNNHADNLEWCDATYNLNYGNVKKKISEKAIGYYHKARPVNKFDKNLNLLATYPSVASVARLDLDVLDKQPVYRCCRGEQKQAYGYIWRFVDQDKIDL